MFHCKVVSHKQVIEVKEIIDSQWVHSLNQDLPLAKEKEYPHVLVQGHDQTKGGSQQQGGILPERCWVQVVLHEGQQQQQQEVMG